MYRVPSDPAEIHHMTPRRWAAWGIVCLLASIFAIAIAVGIGELIQGQPVVEHILTSMLLIFSLNLALWVLFLRGRHVPAKWLDWTVLTGIVISAGRAIAESESVPAPSGTLAVYAALFLAVFLLQWLTLDLYLQGAGALVGVQVGVYVLLYGGLWFLIISTSWS